MNNSAAKRRYHQETLAIHAGQTPDPATMARAVPLYRTTAFNFKDVEHAANLFALKEPGNIYSRIMNPTNDVLEQRLAQMEGGVAALTLSSGTAAIFFTITNILRQGDELVSANNLYGGTYTQFDSLMPQYGITVKFTKVNDFAAVEAAINEKTRAIYIETMGNPVLDFADIEKYAEIGRKHNLPLIVDATFTPPTLLSPIKYGANIVIHSLSKWIGGHGFAIGGIVIDAGNFDWKNPKFTLYNEPDKSYHGIRFAHDLGELNKQAFIVRLRTVGLRNIGPTLAPDPAWLFIQSIESLPLRMRKHSENAMTVAKHLAEHPHVEWVRYPGLPCDPSYATASKYLKNGFGGMVVFGVKGGYESAVNVVNNITLFSHIANVGDAKSLILHPSSTSHSQMNEDEQNQAGLRPELIRLSIGLEHIDDIIYALDEVLDKTKDRKIVEIKIPKV